MTKYLALVIGLSFIAASSFTPSLYTTLRPRMTFQGIAILFTCLIVEYQKLNILLKKSVFRNT